MRDYAAMPLCRYAAPTTPGTPPSRPRSDLAGNAFTGPIFLSIAIGLHTGLAITSARQARSRCSHTWT